jgi:hypothetical protein
MWGGRIRMCDPVPAPGPHHSTQLQISDFGLKTPVFNSQSDIRNPKSAETRMDQTTLP